MSLTSETAVYAGYLDAAEAYFDNGWTDGLPIIPPTTEAVEAFLAAAGLSGPEVLGEVPTRDVVVTAEKTAVNAVMAGCKPEYFPVVVAAVRGILQPMANAHSTTATLNGAAHAVIVNGPVRNQIGVESGQACLGPGFRANATIGRALRLVVRNVLRTVPGVLDRASLSSPLRYSFCFGENEEYSSWTPMHVQVGLAPTDSMVTVQSIMRMVPAAEFSPGPEVILQSIADASRFGGGLPRDEFVGDARSIVVILGPEHQRRLIDDGWTKESMQARLWEMLTQPTTNRTNDVKVDVVTPQNVLIVPAGGPGIAMSWILLPHLSAPAHERVVGP